MKVQILTCKTDYGVGRDMHIIDQLLRSAGHEVTITVQTDKPHAVDAFDLNILIERVDDEVEIEPHLKAGRKSLFVPNLEYVRHAMPPVDLIVAKSRHAETILSTLGHRVVYTSFTSIDRFDPTVARQPGLLHLCGGSLQKGTAEIIDVWEARGEALPQIDLHFAPGIMGDLGLNLGTVPNLTKHVGYLEDSKVKLLQNTFQYHLYPSVYEGFGHAINEAKSVGAVVITTDGPAMNELICPDFGLLVPLCEIKSMGMVETTEVDCVALMQVIEHQLKPMMDDRERTTEMGRLARADFLANDAFFRKKFLEAVQEVA